MSKSVEFFYDYVSSYSYLANSQLASLGAREVVFRPFFLGAVMQATGNVPPATLPAKGAYLQVDLQRWARHYGVTLRMNPVFPQNTLTALRLALVAQREGGFSQLHQSLYDAMWVDSRDLSDVDVLRALMTKAGLDADRYLELCADPEIKELLKANTDEAIARGAFGAPTFFVGDEMFFGNDRLDFVREAIRAG